MNRYLLGGILAVLALLTTQAIGGTGQWLADDQNGREEDVRSDLESLGTLPIDQAGRIVRRQEQSATSIAPASASAGDFTQTNTPVTAPNGTERATIAPDDTFTSTSTSTIGDVSPATGDIAPIDSNLVQPGVSEPTTRPGELPDQDLESIPALW